MGEMTDCYMSEEEKAIERIARRRFEQRRSGPSTDAIDRIEMEKIRQEVTDEFIIMNGRRPSKGR